MLHISALTKQYGAKVLFKNAEAHAGHRSRIALIGPNGSGKSTLIRILLGLESEDCGVIRRANHLAIGHLAQEVPKSSNRTVLQEVMRLDGRRQELLIAKDELEKQFAGSSEENGQDLERYGRILEELDHLDEYRLESRAKTILAGIGFQEKDFDRPLTEFSGGWLMRVSLARVLLIDPDLLLLDEPTNHLDLESLLWLEEFLHNFKGAMILISHDTAFLNRMVNEVWEIDQKQLNVYRGNIDSYEQQKSERLTILRAQYENQQAKIADIQEFVSRFGAKATKARQAQSRLKQLDKMEIIELPEDRSSVRFRFPPAPHSGKEVITLKSVNVAYGKKIVFKNLDWIIQKGARVAIVGINGAGKTTLLKALSGNLRVMSGELKFGHEVKIGYYAQLQSETLNMQATVLHELETVAPHLPVSHVRSIAGAFMFTGDDVNKKCSVLSGGEKARVALAKLLLSPSNFLLLDEPTNHLDVDSRKVLLEALKDYKGTVCLVSHDRDFVSPLVTSVLEIVPSKEGSGDGSNVTQLVGGYEEYLDRKKLEISLALKANVVTDAAPEKPRASAPSRLGPSNNQKRAWERELAQTEELICQKEKRQSELQQILSDQSVYEDKPRLALLLNEQRAVYKELAEKLARWEELSELLVKA